MRGRPGVLLLHQIFQYVVVQLGVFIANTRNFPQSIWVIRIFKKNWKYSQAAAAAMLQAQLAGAEDNSSDAMGDDGSAGSPWQCRLMCRHAVCAHALSPSRITSALLRPAPVSSVCTTPEAAACSAARIQHSALLVLAARSAYIFCNRICQMRICMVLALLVNMGYMGYTCSMPN